MPATLGDLCDALRQYGMTPALEGDPAKPIARVATLEDAGADDISFLSNQKYERLLDTTSAGAIVLRPDAAAPADRFARIRVADPYAAITVLIVRLHGYRRHGRPDGCGDGPPRVHASARVGDGAIIHPGATVDADVVIGRDAVIYPGCYIGPRCRLGDRVVLHPNVVLYEDTQIGDRVTIHANSVIGEDGLGYAPVNGEWVKIPQIGFVEIQDDVEIGAGCAVDRATLGKTVIGRGTKMSNLIAIGHGSRVGEHCLFVAQVGVAGSVSIGRHVTLAGQSGVVGHVRIGDNATVGARAGVTASVPDGETVLGEPARPIHDMRRQVVYVSRLPELYEQVKRLERQVAALRKQDEAAAKP